MTTIARPDRLTPIPLALDQIVASNAAATAVSDEFGEIDYAELARRAAHCANRLTAAGVGAGDRVGVMVRQTRELLVSILAVLRIGAVYVPIDHGYPLARQRLLAFGAGIVALVSDQEGPVITGIRTVQPDGGQSEHLVPAHRSRPDDLACVIHTSGSSGTPKGVMITHRGLSSLAFAAAEEFGLREDDRYLMLASPGFSASLEELFPPLVRGAAVVFAPDREALSTAHGLLEFVASRSITLLELQTAQWHVLTRFLVDTGTALPASLRLMVMGGDRALPEMVLAWNGIGVDLVHVYGPTEATATASYWRVPAGELPTDGVLSIGSAITGTRIVVAGPDLLPVAPGVPGELLIGGDSLARGYHDHPAETARKFVPDAVSGEVGAVLYRTGDLVRALPDGRLQFLERIDQQVKVRGYRIEPAEVEAALSSHSAVRQALVVPREEVAGQRRLVGYVTADAVSPGELREFLVDRLPPHMIPSAIVVLDEFPLTVHHKVDRAALPAPLPPRPEQGAEFVSPAGAVERRLCAMAAELLRVDEIGVLDDFADHGGDSLFLLGMISRIAAETDVRLGLRDASEARTVRGLADLIQTNQAG